MQFTNTIDLGLGQVTCLRKTLTASVKNKCQRVSCYQLFRCQPVFRDDCRSEFSHGPQRPELAQSITDQFSPRYDARLSIHASVRNTSMNSQVHCVDTQFIVTHAPITSGSGVCCRHLGLAASHHQNTFIPVCPRLRGQPGWTSAWDISAQPTPRQSSVLVHALPKPQCAQHSDRCWQFYTPCTPSSLSTSSAWWRLCFLCFFSFFSFFFLGSSCSALGLRALLRPSVPSRLSAHAATPSSDTTHIRCSYRICSCARLTPA